MQEPILSFWTNPIHSIIAKLSENFNYSILANYIDFYSLGWILCFVTLLVYVLSKEQWLRVKKELQQLAMVDVLTNLPNRRLFEDRAEQLLKRSERNNANFAVVVADLDDFRLINDSLGHQAGDLILQAVAKRLTNALRGEDTVARLDGNAFVFLIQDLKVLTDINIVIDRIYEALNEPIEIENRTFNLGISIGASFYPAQGTTLNVLLRKADTALYLAKETKNCYMAFADSFEELAGLQTIAKHNDLRAIG